MYVTLPINSDWIGDIQTVFSDLLLMLQKLFSWENVPLQNCFRFFRDCQTKYTGYHDCI